MLYSLTLRRGIVNKITMVIPFIQIYMISVSNFVRGAV